MVHYSDSYTVNFRVILNNDNMPTYVFRLLVTHLTCPIMIICWLDVPAPRTDTWDANTIVSCNHGNGVE